MARDIIISGFGGQGILSLGKILAYAGLVDDKHVSWLPSYGPEMRGGTANCSVVISDEPVSCPILSECDALIVMNAPSLEKFEKAVHPGGIIIADSTLVTQQATRTDVKYIPIPATKIASDYNNQTYAGIVLLGKLIKETGIITPELFKRALEGILPQRRHYMIPEEMEVLQIGMDA